jgi:Domain of unknown function (DUF4386)
MMNNLQKIGGIAALVHAMAYVVGIGLGIALIFPLLNSDPDQYMAFIADNQALVYVWNLISYWVSAVTLVIMAVALYERLKAGSPALMQTATIFGFIWAALVIGSANLMLRDVSVIADLYNKVPAQAETVWRALDAVETGLASGNEIVGSLWVILLSIAALRTGELPKALNYFGATLGAAGLLTGILAFIPAFRVQMIFAGMIVWSGWLGIVMLRSRARTAEDKCVSSIGGER